MQRINGQYIQSIENLLCERFKSNSDFAEKNVTIFNCQFKGYYLDSLVNLSATLSQINLEAQKGAEEAYQDKFMFEKNPSLEQLSKQILQGKLILFDNEGMVMVVSSEKYDTSRSVNSPQSENPLQSAFDAFTEDIDTNIGMLRKKMVSDQLVIETRSVGVWSTKKLAIVYLKGAAPTKVIESIQKKLEENKEQEVTTVRDLLSALGHPKFAITPTYISSELPGEMIQLLMNGRVVILMDQFSFAFAFPAIVADLWSTTLDVNYPYLFQIFLRTMRAIAALLAITLPGLYVVLNSVNPELLRIQLAITVAKSREGVPYPSLIEMLLVLLLLEMIIEASIRLPKNIGPTITMIGGILLGQAIVQAKLVSNLLLIILVASAIANFALVGYMNTTGIRIYKYVVTLISNFFGIWGLEVAIIWFVLYLASLKISTVPYLSFSVKGKATDE